ncbi:hypothetical protein RBH39_25275, partial [Escherichia coli]|uniref:hypothetical protein n=1 Tax=Escherichia coli TaxID=562 RepID=UPI002FC5D3E7
MASGSTGVVQRTAQANVATLTAADGTAANPGAAQKLTNLAAGTLAADSTDAVNGSQLFTTTNTGYSRLAAALGGGAAYNTTDGTWT